MSLFSSSQQQRGSVVLVALCFLAVLGIALASYLAVSNQAVKLSNREYQRSISEQLAESGIEQSLWSFSWNNWSAAAWDTSIPGSAIRHIPFLGTKYNNGVVGSIMLRVNRWDATVWNNFTTYSAATHDLVWYQGVWYQCIATTIPIGSTPPLDGPLLWKSAPAPWNASANYQPGNIVLYGGSAYVCALPNINTLPTDNNPPAKWSSAMAIGNWDSALNYAPDKVVLFGGMSYRCVAANSNKLPPNPTYWVGAPAIYAEGIATPPDNPAGAITTQLRALVAPASLFPNAIATTSALTVYSSGRIDSYSSNLGVNTYLAQATTGTSNYSAVLAVGSSLTIGGSPEIHGYLAWPSSPLGISGGTKVWGFLGPTSPNLDKSRISRSPYLPTFGEAIWNSTAVYHLNDIVRVSGGKLYVSMIDNNTNQYPPSNFTAWRPPTLLALPSPPIPPIGDAVDPITKNYLWDGDLDLTGGQIIPIVGPVVLDITGHLRIRDGGITLDDPGTAEIHFGDRLSVGSSFTPANPGVLNRTSDPKKLILFGNVTNSAGPSRYSSWNDFYGVIYMPYLASGSLSVSGNIYGAISTTSLTLNSAANFHYDTALRTARFRSIDSPFTVTEWRELTDPTEKIVFP